MVASKRYAYIELVNMTLIGKRAFVDILKDLNDEFVFD